MGRGGRVDKEIALHAVDATVTSTPTLAVVYCTLTQHAFQRNMNSIHRQQHPPPPEEQAAALSCKQCFDVSLDAKHGPSVSL